MNIGRLGIACCLMLFASLSFAKTFGNDRALRCGWLVNPTPGNVSLIDRDAEWIISMQGAYQAKGDWIISFTKNQKVVDPRGYGYGCACLDVNVNTETHEIIRVYRKSARPLSVCRSDKFLKAPE